ncbi:MAG: CoA pyrophosphatase [Pseudomonadota bacterium]
MVDLRTRLIRALEAPGAGSSDFDPNPGLGPPQGRVLRPAAVLVPVVITARGAQVMLTKRSSALAHHPGQVAFPGGKVDAGDKTAMHAALREAEEEVGLHQARVDVLGTLPNHVTVTGYDVTPVVGLIEGDVVPEPEAGEVDEAFFVPLAHITRPENFRIEGRRWQGMMRRYYAVPWGPYYIWGATARMLRGFAERMAP